MKKIISLFLVFTGILLAQLPGVQNSSYFVTADSLILKSVVAAYAANDVVNDSATAANDIFRFKYAAMNKGGSTTMLGTGVVFYSKIEFDTANVTNGTFRLLLFSKAISNQADNAAFTPSYVNNAYFIGKIDFTLEIDQAAGAGLAYSDASVSIPFYTSQTSQYIYGVLLAKGAYTPKQYGKIRITLGISRE